MSGRYSLTLQILSSIATAILAFIIPLRLVLDFNSDLLTVGYWAASLILIFDFFNNVLEYRKHKSNSYDSKVLDQNHDLFFLSIDFIGAIPFVFFGTSYIIGTVRLIKIIRIAQYQSVWNKLAVKFGDYQKLGFFAFWILLVTHWLACGWLSLHEFSIIMDNTTLYIRSLYWTIVTLTTVGYGDITPVGNLQTVYSMVVMIFGVGIYGYVIGNVANILSSKDPSKKAFNKNMENLKAFVQYRDLPFELQNRIRDYFAYLWKKRLGYDESEFLGNLPASLKNEVELYLKRKIINTIPLFKETSEDFLNAIALQLKPAIFLPGDFIIREGDEGNEMYLIIKGKVKVYKNKTPDAKFELQQGSFVGEIALLKNEPRMANVVADTFVDVYVLKRDIFEYVVAQHPGIGKNIRDMAESRLKG